MKRLAWYGLFVVVLACGAGGDTPPVTTGSGGSGGGGGEAPRTLESISVTPLNLLVELDVNATSTQAYTAFANYSDGSSEEVTDQVTWSLSNDAVGSFSGATLNLASFSAAAAEVSLVHATLDDLQGTGQITVVAYRQSGPVQDFFFILPFEDDAGDQEKPLDFSTEIPALDAFFMMDVTGSMGGAINNLQNGLTSTVIPGITAAVANSQFGVGAYADFPVDPYGGLANGCGNGLPNGVFDQPFYLMQTITDNLANVTAGVAALSVSPGGPPIGCGYDGPESMVEGLFQAATGQGLSGLASAPETLVPPNNTGIGGVGFREGTMPVVVAITDIVTHANGESGNCGGEIPYESPPIPEAHTRQDAKDALNAICARVVGISNGSFCSGRPDLEDFATATGARVPPVAWDVPMRPAGCEAGQCCTGIDGTGLPPDVDGLCPVVFDTVFSGTGLGGHVVTGVQMLTRYATFDVVTETDGETTSIDGFPLPGGTTTADFIKAITPSGFQLPPPPPVLPNPTFDATAFYGVTPGTTVSFDVVGFNDFVEATDQALLFRAVIRVRAGGCTDLDQREVFILVPPTGIAAPK